MDKPTPTDYRRISCDIYDQLEAYAVQGKILSLVYTSETGEENQANIKIKDLQTRNKAEFMITDCDKTIRLDRIVSFQLVSDDLHTA